MTRLGWDVTVVTPTLLAFNVTCAVTPMDYRLDGYNWRIKWYVFTDNVSYRHEHLTASEHLLCIQGMSFPKSPLRCRIYPRPSDVYLSPLSQLPLPFISPAHRRPSTTQIYLARSSDSFSVITSELYVVSLPQIIWVCPDIYDGKICKVY